MSEEKKSKLHQAPKGFNVKEHIITLEDEMQLALFGIVGILLIAFPEDLSDAIPYLVGLALLLYGLICLIHCIRFRDDTAEPGFDVMYIILGAAILYYHEDALGPIGSIWALFTLVEVAEEANEFYHHKKKFSVIRLLISIASTALAIMLLFDPFEHFAFHVRILGIEMVLSIFARWGVRPGKDAADGRSKSALDAELKKKVENALKEYEELDEGEDIW